MSSRESGPILITGGAGFIGSHTVGAVQAAGFAVRVLDDLSTGAQANLPPAARLLVGSVTDRDVVAEAAAGCRAVLHLAAQVSVPRSLHEPMETYQTNSTGTAVVLEAARQAGVPRVVLASTCAVYGDLPGIKDEDSPVRPLAPYATSKLMAEQWVQLYAQAYGMETVILRYFNVFGPRQRADSPYSGVIARWCTAVQADDVCRVFGDGEQTRDFISVHDVAQANLLALTAAGTAEAGEPSHLRWGAVYNVATGVSASLNQVLAALERAAGAPVRREYAAPRAGDILHSAGRSDKLRALGWRPTVGLEAGLAELLGRKATVASAPSSKAGNTET